MTRIRNVKNTTKFKRSIKAISPVIATLLMIAIAVVASLVAYAWVMGYMSFTTNNSGKALALPSFSIDDAQDLHVYVQNVGQGSIIISDIYVNDIGQTFTPDPNFPTNELAYGETADLVVPGTFEDDAKLNIKVTAGDGTFMTATGKPGSGGSSNQVGKTDPTVVVSCSPNPVTVNTASTVTVTVTGTGGVTPTGTLTVSGGTGSYGTVSGPTGTGNTATYTVTFTPSTTTGSPFTITANYPGDIHYNSASDTDSLAVSAAKTTPTVVVSCSPNPVTVNTASTVTVTVTGTGGVTPTGTLTVSGGTGSYGTVSGPTGTGNTATYTVTFTPSTTTGSPFTITANYPGDIHYNSASDTDSLAVSAAKTTPTVVVSCSPNPVTVNTASTVTVTVTGTGGVTPTGTLTVSGGTGSYGTVSGPTGTGNTATYTVTFTPSTTTGSPFTITANYPGDIHYNSASDTDSLAVSAAKTTPTVVVSCSPNPVTVNTASTVTVTVTGTGGVTPTGTLTVSGGTGSYGTVSGPTGTGNTATYTVTFTPSTTTGSPFTITANYPGDIHYNSASDTDSLTVQNPKMHIASITMTVGSSYGNERGQAVVTIVDASGNLVSDATVSSSWSTSGHSGSSDSDTTGSNGQASVHSDWVNSGYHTYTVTITDVTKTGWTYDSSANVISTNSISG